MTHFERNDNNGFDQQTQDAAISPNVVEKLQQLVDCSSCIGCPGLGVLVDNGAADIDRLRKAAASPDLFDMIREAQQRHKDSEDDTSAFGILPIGSFGFVIGFSPEDENVDELTGEFLNGILDAADRLEEDMTTMITEKIDNCPGVLSVAGHDEKTRQIYSITTCSDPNIHGDNDRIVPAKVELSPDC